MSDNAPISRLGTLFLLLGLTQAAHSFEEMTTHLYDFFWVMTGAIQRIFPSFPQFRWPADLFAAVNIVLITILLGSWPFVERRQGWALAIAWVAGVIETVNGINHIVAAIAFRQYVPGAITAPFLLVLGPLLLRELRKPSQPLIGEQNS